jgi:NAD(P)-dependent dehydrogenase (short-subunit alcohol dehydrogenase family)
MDRSKGRLEGRVAIVIGAGSIGPGWGNGKATAVRFAQEGASVVAVDVNLASAEETRALIEADGGRAIACEADVTKADQIRAVLDECLQTFGAVDILQNNVGTNVASATVDLSEEDWHRVMDINLTSMFLTSRAVLPHMERQGRGVILNISSVAAIRYARIPYVAYSSSKAAVIALSRTIALEYAKRGVRVNTILPGLMKTPMVYATLSAAYAKNVDEIDAERAAQVPMGRMGDAWDVANASLFLASDEAKFITGTELIVDGGMQGSTG